MYICSKKLILEERKLKLVRQDCCQALSLTPGRGCKIHTQPASVGGAHAQSLLEHGPHHRHESEVEHASDFAHELPCPDISAEALTFTTFIVSYLHGRIQPLLFDFSIPHLPLMMILSVTCLHVY